MRRDRFVVLVIASACAISFLALLDVRRPSDISGGWSIYPWGLQFPPYFGRDYIPIDEGFVDGVSWVFSLSFLALIASALWFTWVWLRQKVADRRLSRQVKEIR
jgi:hypothetical protein